jgi:hypothetical protein
MAAMLRTNKPAASGWIPSDLNAGPSSCFATMSTTPRPRTPASISTGGES